MNSVTLGLSDRINADARFTNAMKGEKSGNFISFESPGLLFKLLTLKRWEIIHPLTGKPQRYSVTITGNYRLTFGWDGEDAIKLDLEDYH